MLLCLDVGNTDIDAAVFDGESKKRRFKLNYEKGWREEKYLQMLKSAFPKEADRRAVDACVLCNVASNTENLAPAMEKFFGFYPEIFENRGPMAIEILTDDPAEVGVDIIAGCMAAKRTGMLPAAVVDMGTATTVAALDSRGRLLGVSILPGAALSLKALSRATGLKTDDCFYTPDSPIGKNTRRSLASGGILGHAMAVKGIKDAFEKRMGEKLYTHATGGLSKLIMESYPEDCFQDDDLLMKGLAAFYRSTKGDRQ